MSPEAFNQLEVILWIAAAAICLIRGRRHARFQPDALLAAFVFLLFAGSDAVEIQTGAWWRPWWLLVWKAGCILTLIWLWRKSFLRSRANNDSAAQ